MKKYNRNKIYTLISVFILAAIVFSACTKFYDPPLIFEKGEEVAVSKKRKVLLIVTDGATSDAVKTIMPPNISKLLEHSKYSWNSFSDAVTTQVGTWVGLTSGTSSGQYGPIDSSLIASNDGDDQDVESTQIAYIPTYAQRLLAAGKVGVRTSSMVVISPWQALLDVPFKYADKKIYAADDEAVKDSALASITDGSLTHLVVDFTSANAVGLAYGFSADVPQYKDAINTIDDYIGTIMDAIKERSSYSSEDWLVIVTGSHGVAPDNMTYGGSSIPEREIFTIYYNENIVKQQFDAPELTNAVNFTGGGNTTQAILAAGSVTGQGYDIPPIDGGEFTMMVKVMRTATNSGNGVIVSKITHPYSNVKGWELMTNGTSNLRICIGEGGGSNTPRYFLHSKQPLPAINTTWMTIALVVYSQGGKRYASLYTDGVKDTTEDISGYPDLAGTTSDLIVGNLNLATGTQQFKASQLGIWNKALAESYIKNYPCKNGISSNDEFYSNLIGYWPCDEAMGTIFKNQSPLAQGKDFIMNFSPTWSLLSANNCSTSDNFLTTALDIVPTIFYWLNATVSDSWKLEGTAWLKDYETEFVQE